MPAGAAQHQHAAIGIVAHPAEGIFQLDHHVVGERIAPFGPVQQQARDRAVAFEL